MLAFKRWIALALTAVLLLLGLPGCKTGAKRDSCQQTNCAATKSPCKTTCASSVCAATGKAGNPVGRAKITFDNVIPQPPAFEAPPAAEAHVFELEPPRVPKATQTNVEVLPMKIPPLPEVQADEFEVPPPAPPSEPKTAQSTEIPLLRVSQTRELGDRANVAAVHVPQANVNQNMVDSSDFPEEALPDSHSYSQAWADALGLPSQAPQAIKPYQRDR